MTRGRDCHHCHEGKGGGGGGGGLDPRPEPEPIHQPSACNKQSINAVVVRAPPSTQYVWSLLKLIYVYVLSKYLVVYLYNIMIKNCKKLRVGVRAKLKLSAYSNKTCSKAYVAADPSNYSQFAWRPRRPSDSEGPGAGLERPGLCTSPVRTPHIDLTS